MFACFSLVLRSLHFFISFFGLRSGFSLVRIDDLIPLLVIIVMALGSWIYYFLFLWFGDVRGVAAKLSDAWHAAAMKYRETQYSVRDESGIWDE